MTIAKKNAEQLNAEMLDAVLNDLFPNIHLSDELRGDLDDYIQYKLAFGPYVLNEDSAMVQKLFAKHKQSDPAAYVAFAQAITGKMYIIRRQNVWLSHGEHRMVKLFPVCNCNQ